MGPLPQDADLVALEIAVKPYFCCVPKTPPPCFHTGTHLNPGKALECVTLPVKKAHEIAILAITGDTIYQHVELDSSYLQAGCHYTISVSKTDGIFKATFEATHPGADGATMESMPLAMDNPDEENAPN